MNSARMWFWILMDILIGSVIVTVLFLVMPLLSQSTASLAAARTITVSATGKTTATPDLAEVSFSVVTQGNSPSTLSNTNNDKMNAVMTFVSSQGIASSDIATTAYNLEPNYQYDQNTQRNFITGYTLTQTVEVKVRDLTKVANVLGGLAPLGVNQIGSVNFTFANPDDVLNLARTDAINKAQNEAFEMSSEAGARLGRVINISENGIIPQPLPYAVNSMSYGATAQGAAVTPNVQPGTQDITDTVNVTYALN